ncbi:putative inorganic phosphate cotransporter [Eupeodes corollae]|uniref:putative inorganic phosphate cotransporter n=1 Tax=Eupeodes corollae TaxID=290404 RepID=UPI0024915ACB|nr:putative inorganic phosphate cotransporter [Eupeodes corollae]
MPPIDENKGPVLGARHLQAFLLFLAIAVCYAGRLNVSVSLVAMTDAETTNPDFHEFNWNEKQKSYILSSFYWGYVVTQFPGAYMARNFGVKTCILIATLGSSICNIILPFCVPWGQWQVYCVIRIIQGLFQGLIFPIVHAHLAVWSPVEERTLLGALSHLGIECGTVLAMSLTGLIAASDLGWPGISYVYGGIGIVFCGIWMIFAENNPADARFITSREKKYIVMSQASADGETNETIPIPWKAILTSVPFISLIVTRICHAWGFSIMQAQIPAYLHGVLNMNIKSNALFSTLPYIAMLACSFIFLILAEIVMKKEWASLGVVRKTINTIAMWGPAALLFGIGFLDENQKNLAIILLTFNVGLNGGNTIGSLLNTIDLSSNHAGVLMSILNGVGNCIPIITPLAVGIIVYDETQRSLWQIVFIIAAILYFVGNLQYIILGSTNTQPWNDEDFLLKRNTEQLTSFEKSLMKNSNSNINIERNSETNLKTLVF